MCSLNVKIVGSRRAGGSFYSKGVNYYVLETISTLPDFQPNKVYKVDRRFDHFKMLYRTLTEDEQYKGFVIPPLPSESTGITSLLYHDEAFLKDRQ